MRGYAQATALPFMWPYLPSLVLSTLLAEWHAPMLTISAMLADGERQPMTGELQLEKHLQAQEQVDG